MEKNSELSALQILEANKVALDAVMAAGLMVNRLTSAVYAIALTNMLLIMLDLYMLTRGVQP